MGARWFVDETYVKVAGVWRCVYRAVDQHVQVIDVYVSKRRNIPVATRFFEGRLTVHGSQREVTTDLAAPLLRVIDELIPEALHDTEQYANDRVECDHGRLKARIRPMRGVRSDSAPVDNATFQHLGRFLGLLHGEDQEGVLVRFI